MIASATLRAPGGVGADCSFTTARVVVVSTAATVAAIDRRRKSQSGLSRIVAKLLGLEMKLRQYEQGKQFCDAIVDAEGPGALHQVFSAPEALPDLDEIEHPERWLARMRAAQAA